MQRKNGITNDDNSQCMEYGNDASMNEKTRIKHLMLSKRTLMMISGRATNYYFIKEIVFN